VPRISSLGTDVVLSRIIKDTHHLAFLREDNLFLAVNQDLLSKCLPGGPAENMHSLHENNIVLWLCDEIFDEFSRESHLKRGHTGYYDSGTFWVSHHQLMILLEGENLPNKLEVEWVVIDVLLNFVAVSEVHPAEVTSPHSNSVS
jgi:hypothetical protein